MIQKCDSLAIQIFVLGQPCNGDGKDARFHVHERLQVYVLANKMGLEYLVTSCLTFIVLTVDFQKGNENWRLAVIVFMNETRKCMIGAVCAENVC